MLNQVLFILILMSSGLWAQSFSFQGYFKGTNTSGIDTIQIDATIYSDAEGKEQVWSEQHAKVVVKNQLYSLVLGSVNPISSVDFSVPHWIRVSINELPGELMRIRDVPTSLNATQVSGVIKNSVKVESGVAVTSLNGLQDGVEITSGPGVTVKQVAEKIQIGIDSTSMPRGEKGEKGDPGAPGQGIKLDGDCNDGFRQNASSLPQYYTCVDPATSDLWIWMNDNVKFQNLGKIALNEDAIAKWDSSYTHLFVDGLKFKSTLAAEEAQQYANASRNGLLSSSDWIDFSAKINTSDIVNNFTTGGADKVLSAEMGKNLSLQLKGPTINSESNKLRLDSAEVHISSNRERSISNADAIALNTTAISDNKTELEKAMARIDTGNLKLYIDFVDRNNNGKHFRVNEHTTIDENGFLAFEYHDSGDRQFDALLLDTTGNVYAHGSLVSGRSLSVGGPDLSLGRTDGRATGVHTAQRALVHYHEDRLVVNFAGDFEGGIRMDIAKDSLYGVGIGGVPTKTETVKVYGNISYTGSISGASDQRYKTSIRNLDGALEKVLSLKPKSYLWDQEGHPDNNFSDGLQYGLIAQEVEAIIPELVHTGNDGYKSVNYTQLIPFLIQSVQEQNKEIEALKKELDSLK